MLAVSPVQAGEDRIAIEGTPLSVNIPSGFVLTRSIHTDSPSIHFNLPKRPDGGTPGYPALSVTQVNPIREPETLDSYIEELQSNEHATIFYQAREAPIFGERAIEIGTEWVTIYHFADGTATRGQTTKHEIIFSHQGHYYICELEAHPEIHERWVDSLRELCSSLQQAKNQGGQQGAPADRWSGG